MIEPGDLLIVDDDEDLRKQMKWGLGQDYQVHEAADRQQAVEVFQDVDPLVITLDLGLPPQFGRPCAARSIPGIEQILRPTPQWQPDMIYVWTYRWPSNYWVFGGRKTEPRWQRPDF